MRRASDAIADLVKSGKKLPAALSENGRRYAEYLKTGACSDRDAETAFRVFDDPVQREILEALLLSGCPRDAMHEAFRIPQASVAVYEELFFDVREFRTELDRISYLEDYPDAFGRELKLRAVGLGYEYVLYTYGNIVPKSAAQKALVQKMFMTAAYKAMNMNYAAMNSQTMRMAVEHGKLMLKAYETLERINSEDTSDTFSLVEVIPSTDDAAEPPAPDGDIA